VRVYDAPPGTLFVSAKCDTLEKEVEKSNYDSSLRNAQNNRGVSVFKFPKNVERKQAWLKAIPRKNFTFKCGLSITF
jgi:hypothetical protein